MTIRISLVAALCFALAVPAAAQAPATDLSALAGKTVRVIIGGSTTGTTGQYARPFAEELRTLLADSTVLIQNIEGGGGSLALTEAQNAGGSAITVVIIHTSPLYREMLGMEAAGGYDIGRFHWLGALTNNQRVFMARASLGVDSVEDLLALDRPLALAAESAGSQADVEARLVSATTGLTLEVLVGIQDPLRDALLLSGDVDLATNNYLAMRTLIDAGHLVPLLRLGEHGYPPELGALPTLAEVARPGTPPVLLQTVDSLNNLGRMVLAVPGTPPDTVAALRLAFDRTVASPALAEAYAAAQLSLEPTSGADLAVRMGSILADPTIRSLLQTYIACGHAEQDGREQACAH